MLEGAFHEGTRHDNGKHDHLSVALATEQTASPRRRGEGLWAAGPHSRGLRFWVGCVDGGWRVLWLGIMDVYGACCLSWPWWQQGSCGSPRVRTGPLGLGKLPIFQEQR